MIYLCPKYVNNDTPGPYREWLLAIQDTLDGEVEETDYHLPEIRKIFEQIEKDAISPQERARMFDEHGQELLDEEKTAKIVRNMAQEGLEAALIAKVLGLTIEEVQELTRGKGEPEGNW